MAGFAAKGTGYLNRIVDGVKQGRVKIPGVTKVAFKPESERKELLSREKDTDGQVLGTLTQGKPTGIDIDFNVLDGLSLAIALMGSIEALVVAGGTATDEAVTAVVDTYIDLASQNITAASVVVQDATDIITYAEGSDYEVNYALGWIKPISGGAISANDVLHIDYAHGAISGQRINGSTDVEVRGEFTLDGQNLESGKDVTVVIDEVVLASSGEVDFMADDFAGVQLSGSMITQQGKTAPYIIDFEKTYS
ncbi:MAG: hypothetical protein COA83_09720 [Methylophaga sp.]|nr:MAG: hypothetical protein COA83_09720 [Methylophaga sp.]